MDGPLERISKCCGRTRRNVTWPQNGLAVSQNKTTRTLIRGYLPAYGPSTACDSQFRNPLVSVRKHFESFESLVIQSGDLIREGHHRCGRRRTADVTTAANCDIRVT